MSQNRIKLVLLSLITDLVIIANLQFRGIPL